MDDASPDNSPRFDIADVPSASQMVAQAQAKMGTEAIYRNVDFTNEAVRVAAMDDTFVPAPGMASATEAVRRERERLTLLEESGRTKAQSYARDSVSFREGQAQDVAALKFQSAFRGHLGRQKMQLTRRLGELEEGSDWIEVRDRKSGDVWWYNKETGLSSWERPPEMEHMVAAPASLKTLPSLQATKSQTGSEHARPRKVPGRLSEGSNLPLLQSPERELGVKRGSRAAADLSPGTQALNAAKALEAQAAEDVDDELGVSMLTRGTLLAPDGTYKPNLRTTIQDALLESRFDSVATVMAEERWVDAAAGPFEGSATKRSKAAASPTTKVDRSRSHMTATVNIQPKKKNRAVRVDASKSDNFQEQAHALTFSQAGHPGFDPDTLLGQASQGYAHSQGSMCFACWSLGAEKGGCSMHRDPNELLPKSQTMLLCRNWDLRVMWRRYRSEDIQEIFLKKASSLKYDVKRKKFMTIMENRHQVYRGFHRCLERNQLRSALIARAQRWLRSIKDEVMCMRARSQSVKQSTLVEKSRVFKMVKSTLAASRVKVHSVRSKDRFPLGSTTGYSWEERLGEIQFLFDHLDPSLRAQVHLINVLPTPVPRQLYTPRQYEMMTPWNIPMPKSTYEPEKVDDVFVATKYIEAGQPGAWLEQMAHYKAHNVMSAALEQIEAITPPVGLELLRKTKYPDANTIKFATLSRKVVPDLTLLGGLPWELLAQQVISTFIPSQYGGFMVMEKAVISPGISPELSASFESLHQPPITPEYIVRAVEHPLNYRRAPSIAVSSAISNLDEEGGQKGRGKHYYGTNRPDQTGEIDPHGFRTTVWSRYLQTHRKVEPRAFLPGADVVALNQPAANTARTTHADSSYPFCEPSSRDNTTLDFYYLMLTGVTTLPQAQVFTALTNQEPGQFMFRDHGLDGPMGQMVVSVYRSWAFTQRDTIEQFESDDGIKYWYHRRTGQTFWEYPKYDEEKRAPLEGGTVLDKDHPEEPLVVSRGHEGMGRHYLQGEFRELMLHHRETKDEALERRRKALASHKIFTSRKELEAYQKSQRQSQGDLLGGDASAGQAGGAEARAQTAYTRDVHSIGEGLAAEIPGPGSAQASTLGSLPEFPQAARSTTQGTHESTESTRYNTQGQQVSMSSPQRQQDRIEARHAFSESGAGGPALENGGATSPSSSSRALKGGVTQEVMAAAVKDNALMGNMDAGMIENLTNTIGTMLSTVSLEHSTAEDMIQVGVGMGMAMMKMTGQEPQPEASTTLRATPVKQKVVHEGGFFPNLTEEDFNSEGAVNPSLVQDMARSTDKHAIGAPVGSGMLNPTSSLPHEHEQEMRQAVTAQGSVALTSMQTMLGVTVKPTDTPDEVDEKVMTEYQPGSAEEAVREEAPLIVGKKSASLIHASLSNPTPGGPPDEVTMHESAGKGSSWTSQAEADEVGFVKDTGDITVRKVVMPLPVGFFNAIVARRVATQDVDYLPQVPNLPQAITVGRVKPRSIAKDWVAVGFDPWSAGRKPLNDEHIPSLSHKAESLFPEQKGAAAEESVLEMQEKVTNDVFTNVEDTAGLTKAKAMMEMDIKRESEFAKISSLARHGKTADCEEMISQPDWSCPIDWQDITGNTLLHISAQNGNKRLVKLCIRRGCSLDMQNMNGQTALHFAFGYGYHALGEYMMGKGCDDSIMNTDGLTPYEGLGADELERL
jgi:hypothetical protein